MKITDTQKKGLKAIMKLDLSEIEARANAGDRRSHHSLRWQKGHTGQLEYRRYLALRLLYPDRTITPAGRHSDMADALWHAHILDTRRYTADCQAIFGEYLHHTPGIQPDGTAGMLYRETFTGSVWGKPDAAIVPFLYTASEGSDPGPSDDGDGEDCA